MKIFQHKLTMICSVLLALAGFSCQASAQTLFTDDFEDRVKDQDLIGPGWTWYNQAYTDNECTTYLSGYGPYDQDPSGATYLQENRNYWTASEAAAGQGDSYFRAGLEVPAWATDEGEKVVLSNMLRIYGDQYYAPPGAVSCKRMLVFQEMPVANTGGFTFSFDMALDRAGPPAFGEVTAAFVKVIKTSDFSYNELLFEKVETNPPVSSTPENASTAPGAVDFTLSGEMVGELLQFGFYVDIVESLGQGWGTSAVLYDNVMLATTDIGPAHSGSWYNVDQSGHGFSIEFGEDGNGNPIGAAYWYTYDDAGLPIFMVGNGIPDGNSLEIVFESPVGMQYGVWDPTSVTREDGGTAVFVFSDRYNATFTYIPSEFSSNNWGHTTPIEDLPLIKVFDIPADKNFGTPD
ncbi:hypothetical protein ACFL3I_04315 [Pseudomonadota bacterium]